MSKILHKTKFLELRTAPKPNGNGEWAYAHRPNVKDIVIIIPLINNESILFLKTRRPPLREECMGKFNIELPAGLVGDEDENETVEEAAKKELLEETGLVAEKFEVMVRKLSSSGGCTSETATLVLAHINNSNGIEPGDDDGVIAERIIVPVKEAPAWLKTQEDEGNTIGAQTLAGLYYVGELLNFR